MVYLNQLSKKLAQNSAQQAGIGPKPMAKAGSSGYGSPEQQTTSNWSSQPGYTPESGYYGSQTSSSQPSPSPSMPAPSENYQEPSGSAGGGATANRPGEATAGSGATSTSSPPQQQAPSDPNKRWVVRVPGWGYSVGQVLTAEQRDQLIRERGAFGAAMLTEESADENKSRLSKEEQQRYAQQFRSNLPQYEQQLLGQLGKDVSGQIKQGTKSIREGAASRGLLKSGLRVGDEGKLRNNARMAMATGAQGIRRGLLSQADKLEAQAIQSGLDIQRSQQQMQDEIYKQAMAEYSAEMGAWGSLAQAGMMFAGMYYAPQIAAAL